MEREIKKGDIVKCKPGLTREGSGMGYWPNRIFKVQDCNSNVLWPCQEFYEGTLDRDQEFNKQNGVFREAVILYSDSLESIINDMIQELNS